jgi:translation elongation factor EF-Tu-like GTPase
MGSFRVEDSFYIRGRGWVVSGEGVDGEIVTGDIVHTIDDADRQFTIRGIVRFCIDIGKPVRAGDRAGLLLRGMTGPDDCPRGTVLSYYDYVL